MNRFKLFDTLFASVRKFISILLTIVFCFLCFMGKNKYRAVYTNF